jgi:hypothetical protein
LIERRGAEAEAMCEKCVELDKKIEQYRALARKVTDQPTLDAIDVLIKKMETRKAALHPEGG